MKLLFCFVCFFLQVVDIESMKHILRYNGMTHTRIHTYPDIFESTTISFRIQKVSRPHVSVFKSNLHVHTYDTYPDSLLYPGLFGNIGIRECIVKRAKFASCSALREPENEVAIVNTVFKVKNWARSCYVTR